MIAFAEGAIIQWEGLKGWYTAEHPFWSVNTSYRIKTSELEIERIESELRKQADITAKLADALKALKDN